jgi:hypothetical protein
MMCSALARSRKKRRVIHIVLNGIWMHHQVTVMMMPRRFKGKGTFKHHHQQQALPL